MKWTYFGCLFLFCLFFALNVVFCGKSALFSLNQANNRINEGFGVDDDHDSLLDVDKILKRNKRYLLFTGGGISKIVLGFLAPVETRDRVNWRTLNLAYNYQAQYVPIPNTTYLWNKIAGDLRKQRKLYDEQGIYTRDLTRDLIYGAMELFWDSRGKPGRECLLKSICDVAEHPIQRGGVFEEIVHLILTPGVEDTADNDYRNAQIAGEHGAECGKIYHCKPGDGFLDRFSYFI